MDNLVSSQDPAPNDNSQLRVNKQIAKYLFETCKWAKFLSIIGFVLTGLIMLMGVSFSSIISFTQSLAGADSLPFNFGWFGIIYVLMGLIYLFPSLYTYRFASKTKRSMVNMSQVDLEEGLKNLKSLFKFFGVFTLIFLSIYVMIGVGMLIGGMIGAFS